MWTLAVHEVQKTMHPEQPVCEVTECARYYSFPLEQHLSETLWLLNPGAMQLEGDEPWGGLPLAAQGSTNGS
jgi:hypothetical protein